MGSGASLVLSSTPLITSAPIAVGSPWTRRALDQRKLSYPCRNFAHMFEGSGFGVGLTVNQLDVPGWPGAEVVPADPGWHPTRLGELMPVAARSDAALAEEMRRANIADSRLWAYRVELIVELAYRRRDDRDRPAGTPGRRVTLLVGHELAAGGPVRVLPGRGRHDHELLPRRGDDADRGGVDLDPPAPDTWGRWPTASWAGPGPARSPRRSAGTCRSLDPHVARAVEAVVLPQAAELSVGRLRSWSAPRSSGTTPRPPTADAGRPRRPPTSSSAGPRSTA